MFCNTEREFIPVATNNNDGYGQWMWAIILFFGLLVFGGGGWFGNNRGNNNSGIDAGVAAILSSLGNRGASADAIATDAAVQRGFDTQNIVGKLDGINNGLCSGFYAMNTTMLQGFNGVDNVICQQSAQNQQGFNNVTTAINQARFENQQCCCSNEKEILESRYAAAQNTCDIIRSQDCNTQKILDKLCQNEIQGLRDKVMEQNNLIQSANFQISQQAQNQYLVNQLRPCPIPAYLSCSPYTSYDPFRNGYGNGCGCNNGCGCGNGCGC